MKERTEHNITALTWLHEAYAQNPYPVSDVWQHYKAKQLAHVLSRGLPTKREESWKYTDISFLEKTPLQWPTAISSLSKAMQDLIAARVEEGYVAVFVNGQFSAEHSSISDAPKINVSSLQQALKTNDEKLTSYLKPEIDYKRYPLAALNAAFLSDGLFLQMPRNVILEKPLYLLSIATGPAGLMMHPRHVIILDEGASLTLNEEYYAFDAEDHLTNTSLTCWVGPRATLNYHKLVKQTQGRHFGHIEFHQKRDSVVQAYSFALDGKFVRNDMAIHLEEQSAACQVKGFYYLNQDKQLVDHHIAINHAAPNTQSDMDFRGILSKASRAVFNGKVKVEQQAQKAEARQVNHNVLLTPLAEIDTKPDLEVYADDVKCSHGATVGQLDEEALFYLRARGLSQEEAKRVLLQAFAEHLLTQVKQPFIHEAVKNSLGHNVETR